MCGILGVVASTPVNQLLYDGLMVLQHRGQDAAGIAAAEGNTFHMHKGPGLVRDVFRTRNMRALPGNMGIGHVRYPTAGSAYNFAEAQPFYVNSPFGIVLAHNGNLTNSAPSSSCPGPLPCTYRRSSAAPPGPPSAPPFPHRSAPAFPR